MVSGAKEDRPELNKLMDNLRKGDVIIFYKLEKLGRSLKHLVEIGNQLLKQGVGLQRPNDPNTSQAFKIFTSLAEFEQEVTREYNFANYTLPEQ